MSEPRGQVADSTIEHARLNQASTPGEVAESFSDTSSSFEAWLTEVKPAPESRKDLTPAPAEFRFEGILRLGGHVKGLVHSLTGTLVLSRDAELESDIVVGTAIIDGCMRGDIEANERVELLSHARVIGNISSPALAIQPGAVFEGECHFLYSSKPTDGDDQESQPANRGDASSPELRRLATEISDDEAEAAAQTLVVAAAR
jgi:cytoskeletal protein CcmA (bactofilin family)